MRVDILTLFPGMFTDVLGESILGRARGKGLLEVHTHDIRAWSRDPHAKVDDRPFGGGPGMVMRCQPVVDAVEAVRAMAEPAGRLVVLTPQGRRFGQAWAAELAQEARLLLVCGRYEGFDERIFELLRPEVLSIGDYVLTGGELPAMVVVDAVARLLPGVLGSAESLEHESFNAGLLDYPQYTQPAEFRGLAVPEVLRSGHHGRIEAWRREAAEARTRRRRPDLPGAAAGEAGPVSGH
jgi:tRNA (guanine37-N1)-methyltransferase